MIKNRYKMNKHNISYGDSIMKGVVNRSDDLALKYAVNNGWASVEFKSDGTILDCNENFLSILEYEKEEVVGKHHRMFCSKEYSSSMEYELFWEKLSTGKIHSGEFERLTKNKKRVWFQASYTPVLNEQNEVVKIIKIAADITTNVVDRVEASSVKSAVNNGWASVEFSVDGMVLDANSNFLDLMGYPANEVIGKHHRIFCFDSYVSSPDYKSFWKDLGNAEIKSGEFNRIDKYGKEVWLQASYTPVVDKDGCVFKIIKIATDITETVKVREQAKLREQQLNLDNRLKQEVSEMINLLNGEISLAERLDQVIGRLSNYLDLIQGVIYVLEESKEEDVKTNYLQAMAAYGLPLKSLQNEIEIGEGLVGQCAKQGKLIKKTNLSSAVLNHKNDLLNYNNLSLFVLPIVQDNGVLQGVCEFIFLTEPSDFDLKLMTESLRNVAISIRNDKYQRTEELLMRLQEQGEELQQQQEELLVSNHELSMSQVKLKEQAEALKDLNYDLELKSVELEEKNEELEKKQESLEKAKILIESKAEELERTGKYKSEFLANMSHEIRTPMNGVIGLIDVLQSNTNLDEVQSKYVQTIKSSSLTLISIINDILDLSKLESGKMSLTNSNFSLKKTVEEIRDLFASKLIEKDLSFVLDYDKELHHVFVGDVHKLKQVLSNLLANAIKFTEQGGIHIQVRKVNDNIGKGSTRVRFDVLDTGIGMKSDEKELLFNAFSQLDSSSTKQFEGTGLGLVISKRIIELLNGSIGVESDYGKGSCFWFELDLLNGDTDKEQEDTAYRNGGEIVHFPGKHVLLVDDKKVNLIVAQALLKQFKVKVTIANDGQEAINKYSESPSKFDLILMDVQMPVMDGVTARNKLEEMFAELPPVIAVTANAMHGDREKYLDAGMNDYLPKPVQLKSLNEILVRWITR